ncbi:ABC transporter substrate-binding protein [Rhodococcus globerulus]|uniref:ABC transporter substrate-binding protein n=1 Tax=Rhodococcus globerulus TaxID=33008 RepID=UPI003017F189
MPVLNTARRSALAGAIMLSVLATACSSPGDVAPAQAAAVDSCDPAGVTIVAQYAQQGDEAARLAKDSLEAKYPGLTVELKHKAGSTSYDELTQQIVSDIAAGNRPDVAMLGLAQTRFWVDQYQPMPIDPDALRETYNRKFLDVGRVDDTPYVAPFQVSIPVLYTNTTLAKNAGVTTVPTTHSELLDNARTIKAADGSVPVSLPQDGIVAWLVQANLQSGGATLVDADGNPAFDTQEGRRALAIYETLGAEKLQDPISYADTNTMFTTGKLTYMVNTPAAAATIQKAVGESFDWTVSAMPVPDGGTGSLPAGGNGWMVLSQDPCKAAFGNELIGAILDPAVIAASAKTYSYVPVDTEAAAILAADPAADTQVGYSWTYDGNPTTPDGWHGNNNAKVNQQIQDMVQRLIGGETVDTVVPEASRRIESVVN